MKTRPLPRTKKQLDEWLVEQGIRPRLDTRKMRFGTYCMEGVHGSCFNKPWRFVTFCKDGPKSLFQFVESAVLCRPHALDKKKYRDYSLRPISQSHTFGNPSL